MGGKFRRKSSGDSYRIGGFRDLGKGQVQCYLTSEAPEENV
jgi:hypothetical protein